MKFRISALLAVVVASLAFGGTASAATNNATTDANALASTLVPDAARADLAGNGWITQPLTTVGGPVATTASIVSGGVNGFPASGANFVYLTNGNPLSGGDPTATTDVENVNPVGGPVHGDANDVSTLKVGLNIPVGANCLSFTYRVLTDESPTTTHYNEGLIAQIDRSDWTVDPVNWIVTAPGNFATADNGGSATLFNLGAQMNPALATGTSLDDGSPVRTATTAITAGKHYLALSVYDVSDEESETGAQISAVTVGTSAGATCGPIVYSAAFTAGKVKTGTGTAKFSLTALNPGQVTVYDSKGPKVTVAKKKKKKSKKKVALIKKTSLAVAAAVPSTFTIKPTAAGKKLLRAKGKFKVKLAIAFKPTGSTVVTTTYKTITIKAKKKKKKKH
jgi:hypothetical protein